MLAPKKNTGISGGLDEALLSSLRHDPMFQGAEEWECYVIGTNPIVSLVTLDLHIPN